MRQRGGGIYRMNTSSPWVELPEDVAHSVFVLLLRGCGREEVSTIGGRRLPMRNDRRKRRRHGVSPHIDEQYGGATVAVVDGLSEWECSASSAHEQRGGLCRACWGSSNLSTHPTVAAAARLTSRSFAAAVNTALPSLALGPTAEAQSSGIANPEKFTGVRAVTLFSESRKMIETSCRAKAGASPSLSSDDDIIPLDADEESVDGNSRCSASGAPGRLALAASLPNLTSLDTRRCGLTSARQLGQLASLTRLRRLALGHVCSDCEHACNTTGELDSSGQCLDIATVLSSLSKLTALDLSACDTVGDLTLAELAAASPPLACLNLADCWHLSWAGIAALAPLSSTLTCLNLSGCRALVTRPLASLAPLTQLSSLSLRSCSRLLSADLEDMVPLAASLTSLDLGYCSQLDLNGVAGEALGALTSLSTLNLTGTQAGDDVLAAMGSSPLSSSLSSLCLALCYRVTDTGLQLGVARLSSLTSLSLAFCSGISNTGVASLHPLGELLAELDLTGCYRVNGLLEGGSSLFDGLRHLHRLDLSKTGVTDEAVAAVARRLNRLQEIRLASCSRLTYVGLQTLQHASNLSIEL